MALSTPPSSRKCTLFWCSCSDTLGDTDLNKSWPKPNWSLIQDFRYLHLQLLVLSPFLCQKYYKLSDILQTPRKLNTNQKNRRSEHSTTLQPTPFYRVTSRGWLRARGGVALIWITQSQMIRELGRKFENFSQFLTSTEVQYSFLQFARTK